ncbi:hypothetical protein DCAR_0205540 [Daucus carota subsp. sativus]|uniref:GOST seven transmembrane domain-containing protein n=1 Tax=Daucus carota subsp. sativus TaxID=79200 RepID=A0A166CPV7_DAUCS|nr:hypothetical protein DCAR_0205540 [Daucus carota subsp. sativus]
MVLSYKICNTKPISLTCWYFEYVNLNATGIRPVDITLWATTIISVKKTLTRLLLLVVSTGYGVVPSSEPRGLIFLCHGYDMECSIFVKG